MFCPNCGTKLPDNAKFCSACGKPVPTKADAEPVSQNTGESPTHAEVCRLTIRRLNQFYAYNPAMKVYLDGKKIGAVKNGTTVTFEVPKGIHTLCVAAFFRKKKVTLSFSDDIDLDLKWSRLTGGIIVKTPNTASKKAESLNLPGNTEAEGSRTSSLKKIAAIGGGVAAVIVVVFALLAIFGSSEPAVVSVVRNGYLGEYTDMTVEEILNKYYGSFYTGIDAVWDSGITDDGTTIVQVEYCDEALGTTTIQFSMLDEEYFKVTAFVSPFSIAETATDLLAELNQIYIVAYESQYMQSEMGDVETLLLEHLSSINATSVRYGASKDYTGDRAQLYQLFNDITLDMSVVELLATYGVIDNTIAALPNGMEISDFCGTWCSEGTVPWDSGLTLELQIEDFDDTHWNVYLNVMSVSAPPSMRIASVEKSVHVEKGNPIVVSFDDDGWFNKGVLNIELLDDGKIGFSCEITEYGEYANWDLGMPYTILSLYETSSSDNPATIDFSWLEGQYDADNGDNEGRRTLYLEPYYDSITSEWCVDVTVAWVSWSDYDVGYCEYSGTLYYDAHESSEGLYKFTGTCISAADMDECDTVLTYDAVNSGREYLFFTVIGYGWNNVQYYDSTSFYY